MNAVTLVTDKDVDAILIRMEDGKSDCEDANCLRNYIRGLRSIARAALLQGDDDANDDKLIEADK